LARSSLPTHVASPPPNEVVEEGPDELDELEPARRVAWRPWTAFAFTVIGFGISFYLTIAHFDPSAAPLYCTAKGAIDCQAVTTSPESMVFGIFPVALLGLIFYTSLLVLNFPALWRSPWRLVAPLRMAAMITGIGFVLYLISVEALQVHKICLWCSGVHLCTFVLFLVVATGWEEATAASRQAQA
jgi:uncharacterized membrane protein